MSEIRDGNRERLEPVPYVLSPLAKFPKRWRDHLGPIRVMSEPIEGYLLVRRTGCMPFALSVRQLLNTEKHPVHGPFRLADATKKDPTP